MALGLYVNTFRIVLRVNPTDASSWSHIYGSLCCLRESLTCSVCRKLLINPNRPTSARCQHNVCKKCVGGKMQVNPQCKLCTETQEFEENVQLRIILQCYKRMCKYIISSEIFRCWRSNKFSSPMLRFISMVYEGAGLDDDYHFSSSNTNGPVPKMPNDVPKVEHENAQPLNGHKTIYSIKLSDIKSPKVMIRKTSVKEAILAGYIDSDVSSDASQFGGSNLIEECLKSVKKRKSCRCGMATRNPGKLTCCGQRCPCYVGGRVCFNCRCRGCRNPQKNLVSSPPVHNFHGVHSVSTDVNMNADAESSDEISCSDSDKDASV